MLSHVVNITLHSVSITWCKLWQQFGWQLLYWNGCTSYASRLPFHWLRLIQRITLWCPPLPANFLKRELPQPSSLRRVTLRSIGCLQVIAVGLRLLSTQVYKPLFPAFFSQFLDFSPYEQHIFVHFQAPCVFSVWLIWAFINGTKHRDLEFLILIPMEKKITSCPPAAFRASSESRVCKRPIFCSIILLSYR